MTYDSIYLTSDSTNITNLNAHGDDKIAGVEAISAASATAGVTINLNRQTEAFSITGGKGADTIDGGAGNDTIKLANGDFAAGEFLTGGSGTDTIVLTNATRSTSPPARSPASIRSRAAPATTP